MKRLPTGIASLDVILDGGLVAGSTTVLAGAPGTGKTILAQQMCFANASADRRAVYYTTMSEPHSKLVEHLAPFDFFTPQALESKVEYLHLGELIQSGRPGRLEPMVTEVVRKAMDEDPVLVVIDSAKALRDFTGGQRDLRAAFYELTSRMAHTGTALLLVGEYTPKEIEDDVEFALADTIIQLAYQPREPVDRRWLRVVKMRGAHHLEGKHTFRIGGAGFEVFPRIETIESDPPVEVTGRIRSGTPGLDELMGGGIGAGETTLILGPSGVGKTILGLRFVAEGVALDERCLYVTFQDTAEQLIKMADGFGWGLDAARASGKLTVQHVPIGELDIDMLAAAIRHHLADGSIRRVVIDSLAELVFAARESDRFPAYARSLTGFIRAAGASLVIISETTTLGPSTEPIGGVTFLFHNVILLRSIELVSSTGRVVNVVKMRNSDHSKDVHQFEIGKDGLIIGNKIDDIGGVLGWSALRTPATTH